MAHQKMFEEVNNLLMEIDELDNKVLELVLQIRNIVETQNSQINLLQDENESLWFMLEEIKKSDIAEWAKHGDNASKLQERVDDTLGRLSVLVNRLTEA